MSVETVKCVCGNEPGNRYVETKCHYSFWGWFALSFGMTVSPKSVDYLCRQCGRTFGWTDDPEVLRRNT